MNIIIVHGMASTLFELFFYFVNFLKIINPLCQKFQKHYQNSKKPYLNVAKFEPWPSLGKLVKFGKN